MEAVECGAAALGSVLAYFGRVVTLEELRLACGVSRDGSKASNLVKAARNYGLIPHAYKKEPDDLGDLDLPLIVFWNFNHFVVVDGFGKDKVYLNDPAVGPRTVTSAEFDRAFTGVVITFEVGPEFEKGGRFPSLRSGLANRLRGSEHALIFTILVGLCLTVPGLVIPTFTRTFVDNVLVGGLSDWARPLLLAMLGTLIVVIALNWLQQYYLFRMSQKLYIAGSARFFWHVLRLPVEFFNLRFAGDIAARAGLNHAIAALLSGQLASSALAVLSIVFYAAVMLQYSIPLTLLGIGFAAVNLLALRVIARRRVDASRRLGQETGKLISASYSGLQMIETLKASGTDSDFFARWAGYQAKALNAQQELAVYTAFLLAIPALLASLSTAAILALGGDRVIAGSLSIGSLVAFQALMASFSSPVNRLVGLAGTAQEVEADMARLDDVLHHPLDPVTESDRAPRSAPGRLEGELELRNITFGYSRLEPPLIANFSLHIRPGGRVALVGGSGSGKSTIARLVAGVYEPWNGDILFDGQSRAVLGRDALTTSLAAVDQDVFLFEGSVEQNLSLWDVTLAESRMVSAAMDARIHDDVAGRAGGYASVIEEGGRNFSGGQRQRLEIARALANNPRILILDEATSALDALTEQQIDDALRRRGCTCLIVAHRLSAIRDCDEIVVLEQGHVVQRGTHDEMKLVDGPYAHLIAAE